MADVIKVLIRCKCGAIIKFKQDRDSPLNTNGNLDLEINVKAGICPCWSDE